MSEVHQLEKQLEDSKFQLARRDMALKLSENHEFRKLIIEDFCVTECAKYAQRSGDPMLGDTERADALALAQSSGHLKRYLSAMVLMGNAAANMIPELEEALEQARAETGE